MDKTSKSIPGRKLQHTFTRKCEFSFRFFCCTGWSPASKTTSHLCEPVIDKTACEPFECWKPRCLWTGATHSPTSNSTRNTEQLFQSCFPNCTNIISSQGCWKQQFCHLSAYSHRTLVRAQVFVKPCNDPEGMRKLTREKNKPTISSFLNLYNCACWHEHGNEQKWYHWFY